jgi:acetyl-CoA C-acetyltransferase
MRSIILAHDIIKAGSAQCIIAGGMESMTNAPYLSDKARSGLRMGHAKLTDHMFFDGLEDAYETGTLMGHYAEKTASKYNLSRKMQDDFALKSYENAKHAMENGYFANQMVPVTIGKDGKQADQDEPILNARPEKIPNLKPAFTPDGTVTAANASGISDGAAALVLMPLSLATKLKLRPRAQIIGHAQYSHEPQWFTTAPIGAMRALTQKIGWDIDAVDLLEINEAFAVVTLSAIQELKLDPNKVNIHGGACALGHPIGATGARLVVSLLNALELNGLKRGIASPCIGGGEATAIAIEVMD